MNTPPPQPDPGRRKSDFVPPGGIPAPEHLTFDYVGHLLNNIFTSVIPNLIYSDGHPGDEGALADLQLAAADLRKYIHHLSTDFAEDLTGIPDLQRFLKTLARMVSADQISLDDWRAIIEFFNSHSGQFGLKRFY